MKRTLLILLCIGLTACSAEEPVATEKLVIDGWIDAGGHPVIMVSSTLPIGTEAIGVEELKAHVENWARVIISDGSREIVLTGEKDDRYFPPYIYTTSRMRGEEGKTYTIEAYCRNRTVTARTTIPEKAGLKSIKAIRSSISDSLYTISAELEQAGRSGVKYKVFTMVEGRDSTYRPSFLGNFDDTCFSDGQNIIGILPPASQKWKEYSSYFRSGDIVRIKFCALDEDAYAYWCDYEDILTLSRNPLFPVAHDVRSNIEGGLGLWAGYGATFYTIAIP